MQSVAPASISVVTAVRNPDLAQFWSQYPCRTDKMHKSDTDMRAGQIIYWAENITKDRKGIIFTIYSIIFTQKKQTMINTVGSKH